MEDPCEPDENTARTLTAKHLEELRAELNRATFCLSGGGSCNEGKSRSSKRCVASWARVCQSPAGKRKLDDLKAFLMPVGSTQQTLGRFVDVVATTPLSDPVKAAVCNFWEHGLPNSKMLVDYLSANERRSLHHCCELCGIKSSKVGKAKQGAKNRYRVEIAKPTGWTRPARWANSCLQSTESFNGQSDGGGSELGGGGGGDGGAGGGDLASDGRGGGTHGATCSWLCGAGSPRRGLHAHGGTESDRSGRGGGLRGRRSDANGLEQRHRGPVVRGRGP
mmetsp:Transcript_19596/g.41153  ORF Transcript_19596/g.41153 Transcript_19596/m.41153 type:complete len:278 (+) Transcript_19596:2-835(+)